MPVVDATRIGAAVVMYTARKWHAGRTAVAEALVAGRQPERQRAEQARKNNRIDCQNRTDQKAASASIVSMCTAFSL